MEAMADFNSTTVMPMGHGLDDDEDKRDVLVSYVLDGDGSAIPSSNEGLAVAVAVEEKVKNDGPVTFAQEVDLVEKIPLHKTKKFWVFSSVLVFLIAGITVGATIGGVKEKIVNERITNAPSLVSSSAPSTARDGIGVWQVLDLNTDVDLMLALQIDTKNEEILKDVLELRETPQFMAADWIVNEDLRMLSTKDPNLVQRYVLAILYFSTKGDKWWSTKFYRDRHGNSTFINEEHECTWYGIECNDDDLVTIVNQGKFSYDSRCLPLNFKKCDDSLINLIHLTLQLIMIFTGLYQGRSRNYLQLQNFY